MTDLNAAGVEIVGGIDINVDLKLSGTKTRWFLEVMPAEYNWQRSSPHGREKSTVA